MKNGWVSDEVWGQLDPRGSRLSRRDRWRIAGAALVAALLGSLYLLGAQSGLLGLQVGTDLVGFDSDTATHTFTIHYRLTNSGWFDEKLRDVTDGEHGLRLTHTNPGRFTIPAGRSRELVLQYQVTDCTDPESVQVQPTLHLDRSWGTRTMTVPHQDFGGEGPVTLACSG